jgi:hypothetical protein
MRLEALGSGSYDWGLPLVGTLPPTSARAFTRSAFSSQSGPQQADSMAMAARASRNRNRLYSTVSPFSLSSTFPQTLLCSSRD